MCRRSHLDLFRSFLRSLSSLVRVSVSLLFPLSLR